MKAKTKIFLKKINRFFSPKALGILTFLVIPDQALSLPILDGDTLEPPQGPPQQSAAPTNTSLEAVPLAPGAIPDDLPPPPLQRTGHYQSEPPVDEGKGSHIQIKSVATT